MGTATGNWRAGALAAVRVAGLAAICLVANRAAHQIPAVEDPALPWFGISLIVGMLWLAISGTFGFGGAERRDWVGLVPFAVALVVRAFFTLHSVEEIEIKFAQGPIVKHSVVYALAQLFYTPLVRDPQRFTMHLNGVLGAIASLALYQFVRQRMRSRTAAVLCALMLAVHPVVARFAPTDGPYSLLLAAWFAGLALLSASPLAPRALLGGIMLLGIAATTRIEGAVILPASLLLLDAKRLLAGVRADPLLAAFAVLVVASLGAVQMYALLGTFLISGTAVPLRGLPLRPLFTEAVSLSWYGNRPFVWVFWLGAASGVLKRYRLGLGAFVASLIVAAPIVPSSDWLPALHRLVPTCALQAIVAGMGAYALTAWFPRSRGWRWLRPLPGVALAASIFIANRGMLIEPYPFAVEYDLLRTHLAPGGRPLNDCTLLISLPAGDSLDLHDPAQAVPELRVLDCNRVDCLRELSSPGCFYYYRATAAYAHPGELPPGCTAASERDPAACVNREAGILERAMSLQEVETRLTEIGDLMDRPGTAFPTRALVGLYRVGVEPVREPTSM